MKLPKFNKGKPAPAPATETKKTHIVANAGFFKELMAPALVPSKPPPPPPSASKASSSLSVTTGGTPKLLAKPQVAESTMSPSKSAPSPPTTPTTPATPITPTISTSDVSTSSLGLPLAANETMPEPDPVPESPVPVAAPVAAPTAAALQAIAAAVATLTEAKSISTSTTAASETPSTKAPATTEIPIEPTSKPVKPKKVVRFKAADELEMIRYFFSYNDAEEKENEETLLRGDLWRPPPMLVLACNAERGSASVEKAVQEKREAETLSVNYIREAYIPISPAEPDPDPMDATSAADATASSVPSMATTAPMALPNFEVKPHFYFLLFLMTTIGSIGSGGN
jgi:hypothetical protein